MCWPHSPRRNTPRLDEIAAKSKHKRAQRKPGSFVSSSTSESRDHEIGAILKMTTALAHKFRAELTLLETALAALPHALADTPWRPGGWTRKQIVGHLLDSATNNRQRFVRAAIDGFYAGPSYGQDAWVNAHGYAAQSWATLIDWWKVEHQILAAVVDLIPEERLEAQCTVGEEAPVSLRFLIEDYLLHQQGHFAQLTAAT